MALLEVSDVSFGYTNEALFTGVALKLEAGERAGLVAPNGAGKSTLLRVLAGELEQDRGFVVPKKGAKIGYYRQSHEVKAQGSVMEVLLSGFGELVALRQALAAAQEAAASGEAAALEKLSELDEQYHRAGADALERRRLLLPRSLAVERRRHAHGAPAAAPLPLATPFRSSNRGTIAARQPACRDACRAHRQGAYC